MILRGGQRGRWKRRGPDHRRGDQRAACGEEATVGHDTGWYTLGPMRPETPSARHLAAVALVSATLLMTELALTRIFSVIMYYHFAFLAISIALFGISASGVLAYVARRRLATRSTDQLLSAAALLYTAATIVSLYFLVRLRVGLSYSPENLRLMLTIYAIAALPFFSGGLVVTLAISRLTARVNSVYAADLIGAALGCLLLIPLLDRVGAPGVVLTAAAFSSIAATLMADRAWRIRIAGVAAAMLTLALAGQLSGAATFDVVDTKGHKGDTVLFSKWNSFSRIGVYEREHGDWSLSPSYKGPRPDTRFMDIDSAASTPILRLDRDLANAQYLRYELTSLAYRLVKPGFRALVIGPGGGRDLASALVFGAAQVDGVEINPIIADDVMRNRFRDYSGGIYTNPRVAIAVDDGRSFVRRTPNRYDVIQASLVDTWAATAAGAYTLTENTLYTVDAFDDYLDHLTEGGALTITRWVFDGLRLVSLAQEACARHGWAARDRILIVRHDRVATFVLKRAPFTPDEVARARADAEALGFEVLYAPGQPAAAREDEWVDGVPTGDYARLITVADRDQFYEAYHWDVRPTTDDRPFFFHTTKLRNQFDVAFGRSMLFGNGLSALMTLLTISIALIALFVLGPLAIADRGVSHPRGWLAWLVYFGALGAGFMLIEVSVLQRFVLLLGHPVYSLTVTLFSLLLGTGIGAAWSRRVADAGLRSWAARGIVVIAALAVATVVLGGALVEWAIPFPRAARIAVAVCALVPVGIALGMPMPAGLRMLSARAPDLVPWAWGLNGALSVLGATLAIFIAMNWGFATTLFVAAGVYLVGLAAMLRASSAFSGNSLN
jgi:spermidine synthase